MKKKLSPLDKIYIPLLLALVTWAGSQLMEVERLEEKVKHPQEKAQENRDAAQGLIELHLNQGN